MTLSVKLRAPIGDGKRIILSVVSHFRVKLSRIRQFDDGVCEVLCNSESDVDNLLSPECVSALKSKDCLAKIPADLRAKRAVLLRKVDSSLLKHSNSEIRDELISKNPWLMVDEVLILHKSSCIKLICVSQQIATKATEIGVKLFHFSVPPFNISKDIYVKINICYRCYKLDSHSISSCPENQNYKACSLCSSLSHTYRECDAELKKCLNCNGPHSAMAFSCPKRRELEQRKRLSSIKHVPLDPNMSYSASVSPSASLASSILKAHICVAVASLSGPSNSDSFQITLDKVLLENNLPTIKLSGVNVSRTICTEGAVCGQAPINAPTDDDAASLEPLPSFEPLPTLELPPEKKSSSGVVTSGSNVRTASSSKKGSLEMLLSGGQCGSIGAASAPQDVSGCSSGAPYADSAATRITRSRKTGNSEVPSAAETANSRGPVVRTASCRDIKIYKCKGTQRITPSNIKSLATIGKVFVECSSADESKCLDMLSKKNTFSSLAFSNIVELSSDIFHKRLNANFSSINTSVPLVNC